MGRHAKENHSDTHLFGLIAREPSAGHPEPDDEPESWDLTEILRAVPPDMEPTAELPIVPEPEPPEYPTGPPFRALRWYGLAAAVALVLLLGVACSLMAEDDNGPAAFAGRAPAVSESTGTAEPEEAEPADSPMVEPEPRATATRTVTGPTVTVRPESAQSGSQPAARPVPTTTVTRTVRPEPSPAVTVTVTRTALRAPEPAPTVTVTHFITLPPIVPSP